MPIIKKKVKVVREMEIEIELPDGFFGDRTEKEFIKEWCEGLWDVDSVDDIIIHAAEMVCDGMNGHNLDGLGMLVRQGSEGDTKFKIINDEFESEVI